MFSSRGISSTPHKISSSSLFWHVPLRASSQEPSREASQRVRPGRGGAVDWAAIDPCCHQVDLHVLNVFFLNDCISKGNVFRTEVLQFCTLQQFDDKAKKTVLFNIETSQWSAPVCEGCSDSVQTLCPMALSERAARHFQWTLGQRRGHLLGPGCSWTRVDTQEFLSQKFQRQHDNLKWKINYFKMSLPDILVMIRHQIK